MCSGVIGWRVRVSIDRKTEPSSKSLVGERRLS
jgi:hypothetical protein